MDADSAFAVNGHFTRVISRSSLRLGGGRRGLDGSALALQDGDAGGRVVVAAQVHVDGTGSIVVNHCGRCAQGSCHIGLFKEGGGAPGAEDHLSLEVHALVILRCAEAVHQDIGNHRTGLAGAGIQGGHGKVVVAGGFGVDHRQLAHGKVLPCGTPVLHRGHSQGVGIRARGAYGVHAHAVVVQKAVCGSPISPGAGVAGGNNHNGIGVLEAVQQLGIGLVGGLAGSCRAQRQVHSICAQHNGILNGHHIVGLIGAALLAKDLHGEELGIGSHTADIHRLCRRDKAIALLQEAVGRGNAGHMRAVLSLCVMVMCDLQTGVHVVVAQGQLLIEVQVFPCQLRAFLMDVKLFQEGIDLLLVQKVQLRRVIGIGHAGLLGVFLQSMVEGLCLEGLMVRVRAGVDYGNPGSRAGVALQPGRVGADHTG